ncbi:MAG: PAS domain S-box protein [Syntrophomonadaceae bacterium]|nr:PAS domain S-box protein [Syntrophomonadaceae bacterium]
MEESNMTRDVQINEVQSLEKSAENYKIAELQLSSAIFDTSEALILVSTPQGKVVSFNKTCEEVSGYSFAEVKGKYIWNLLVNENESKIVRERYERLKSEELSNTGETYWLSKSGEKRTIRWTNTAILNQEGIIEYIVSSGIDITERKKAEVLYKTLFENTGDTTVIIEADMTISMVNRESKRFGYKKEELEGEKWTEFFSRPVLKKMKKYHRLRREEPTAAPRKYKTRLKDKEGKLRDALVIVDIIPGTQKSIATFIDISEQTRIIRALKTLSTCNNAIIHAIDVNSLLNSVCRKIVKLGGYQMAWVGFTDRENIIVTVAHAGDEDGYLDTLKLTCTDSEFGVGPVCTAIRTNKVTICKNVMTDPNGGHCREEAVKRGYQSVIAIPLKNKGDKPFGSLNIYSAEKDVFDKEEVKLLKELASDLTYGIMSHRARAERNKATAQLQQSLNKMQRILKQTVGALSTAMEIRDPYTAGHQRKVAGVACAIAREMGLSEEQIEGITVAGNLHDIGKISVPSEILNRPGKLTKLEFDLIKTHPQVGYEILQEIEFDWPVAEFVHQHHERIDGSGYPNGLTAKEILLEAKILAVADVVEAIASHRPYRPALGLNSALEAISKGKGTLYDPEVVDACLKLFKAKDYKIAE